MDSKICKYIKHGETEVESNLFRIKNQKLKKKNC